MKNPHAQIQCVDALRIAKETLDWIKTQRELKVEKWIQEYMKEDQRGFWATLFRKPPIYPTQEQAEKALHEETVMDNMYDVWCVPSAYQDIQEYYQNREALARRIIKLAQFSATGQITMTDETIDSLIR